MTLTGERCLNCGNDELAHLRGLAKKKNGKYCPGYKPEGGVTKKQGLDMIRAAAKAAEARDSSKKR